jgi:hypothetical protein
MEGTNIAIITVIEACIFLIPFGTLLVKLGKYVKRLEVCENEIKDLTEIHKRDVEELKENNSNTIALLNSMCVSLGKIEKTVELLLNGKLNVSRD